jgi:hypothetical protein
MNKTDGVFSHNLPQFGQMRVNNDKYITHLKIEPPPNDKKRHDPLFNISLEKLQCGNNKNILEIMQILEPVKDPFKYACGIFVVATYDPHDLINYVKQYQDVIPFEKGLEFVRKWFSGGASGGELDCEVVCRDLKFDLKCTIT